MMALTSQQKKALIAILVLGVAFLAMAWWYWTILGKGIVEQKNVQIDKTRDKIRRLDAQLEEIRELERMKDKFAEIEAKLDQISRRLPPSPEAPEFFNALNEALRSTGIETRKIAPDKLNPLDRFTEIPYIIEAFGRYHEIGQFLTLVEENPQRFMRVKTLTIKNDENRPSLHPVDVGLATFMFSEK